MTQIVEAIYTHGHLEPVKPLELTENQRVELTIRSLPSSAERDEARRQLIEGLKKSNLRLTGPAPTREELHERC